MRNHSYVLCAYIFPYLPRMSALSLLDDEFDHFVDTIFKADDADRAQHLIQTAANLDTVQIQSAIQGWQRQQTIFRSSPIDVVPLSEPLVLPAPPSQQSPALPALATVLDSADQNLSALDHSFEQLEARQNNHVAKRKFTSNKDSIHFAQAVRIFKSAQMSKPCTKYKGLASAWNGSRFGLRHGDRAQSLSNSSSLKLRTPAGRRRTVNENKWHLRNVVLFSYRDIGKHAPHRKTDVGDSRRPLDALVGSVALHDAALTRKQRSVMKDDVRSGLVINRNHDATPINATFGSFAIQLADFARYLHKREDGKWILKSLEAMREIRGASFQPRFGVVEFFVQRDTICYLDESGKQCNRTFMCKPCILSKSNASTIFNALEQSNPVLDLESLAAIAERVKLVLISECPDGLPANGRKMKATHERLGSNILYVKGHCVGHVGHLIIEDGMSEKEVIGDMHAIQYIAHIPSTFNRMVATARRFILEHLELHSGPPPIEYAQHTSAVLRHTIRRYADYVRGRLDISTALRTGGVDAADVSKVSKREAPLSIACERILVTWNGDVRKKKPSYWLNGRDPAERETIVNEMTASALHGGLLQGERNCLPSTNKWGTCAEAGARASAGFMICDILGSTLVHTFNRWENGDPGEEHSEDFRLRGKAKGHRAMKFGDNELKKRGLCTMVFVTPPVDNLWRRVQLPVVGTIGALSSLENPFLVAGCSLALLLTDPKDLRVLARHFGNDEESEELVVMCHAVEQILHMAAHVFWRLEIRYDPNRIFPYRMSIIPDENGQPCESGKQICEEIFALDECELDEEATLKVKKLFGDPMELWRDPGFNATMLNWRSSPLANMSIENLLALLKASCPDRSPLVERLLTAGSLTQVLSSFINSGREDPRVLSRASLCENGAPINAARSKNETKRTLPANLRFANHELRKEKRLRIVRGLDRPPFQELTARRRALIAHFESLPAEERNQFKEPDRPDSRSRSSAQLPAKRDPEGLWGLYSEKLPVDMEYLREGLLEACAAQLPQGDDDDEIDALLPGFTPFAQKQRQDLINSSVIVDAGELA
jgi:hypothetical protein